MATGKTSRYRHNVRLETILSQAPNGDIRFFLISPKQRVRRRLASPMEKVQRLNGSGLSSHLNLA